MESRKDEVAGLGSGQRRRDRLEVSHLAEEDHVGVLAERAAQSVGERGRVGPSSRWLTMHRLWRWRNSIGSSIVMMLGLRPVDLVDQGGERGRLTRAGRPGDQHESTRFVAELAEGRREAELLEALQIGGNEAKRTGEAPRCE